MRMRIIIKEEGLEKEVNTDKYYFDEIGNEFRYDSSGKRHYTREEG